MPILNGNSGLERSEGVYLLKQRSLGFIMRQRYSVCVILLSFSVWAQGQSSPSRSKQSTSRPATVPPSIARPEPRFQHSTAKALPKYLSIPVDVEQTNLGPTFAGHDIAAVFTAIKNSPA